MKMQMKTKTTRQRNKDEGMQKNEDKYEEYTENHMILRNVSPQKLFPSNVVCRIV